MKHNESKYQWYQTFGEVLTVNVGPSDMSHFRKHHCKAHEYDDGWLLFVTPTIYYELSQDEKEAIKSWDGIKGVLCFRPSDLRKKNRVTWKHPLNDSDTAVQLTYQETYN